MTVCLEKRRSRHSRYSRYFLVALRFSESAGALIDSSLPSFDMQSQSDETSHVEENLDFWTRRGSCHIRSETAFLVPRFENKHEHAV